MKQPLLVLDVHYLAHRAFHSSQSLSWGNRPTGVIFQFLKGVTMLKDEFQTDRIAFCFEHSHLLRKDVYPPYKRKRHTKERTPEEIKSYKEFHQQIHALRDEYLPEIGFKNIFCCDGYESDDVMAGLARNSRLDEEVILVTADSDLWQCLSPSVTIYSPQRRMLLTHEWFTNTYGIRPSQWAVVKAMAGCNGDEVTGIKGVGEKTALRYLKGDLKKESAIYQRIVSLESGMIVQRNRHLVHLPYKGCPVPDIQEDVVSKKKWLKVCESLGMHTIAKHPPVATRRLMAYGSRK